MKTTFKAAMFATTIALGLSVAACGEKAATEEGTETPADDTMVEETVVEEPATDAMGETPIALQATTADTMRRAISPSGGFTEHGSVILNRGSSSTRPPSQ